VLGPEKRVQLHLSHDWSFGILPDLEKDFAGNSLGLGRLNFMADRRHLITARHHPMRVIDDIRPVPNAATDLQGPAGVLVRHVERFIDLVEARLNDLGSHLDTLEDMVLADRDDIESLPLGPVRSELSRYHREFAGLRSALHRAVSHRPSAEHNFLEPHLPRLIQEAEDFDRDTAALQDRARLLYEEMDSRIAAITNRAVRTLTIFSTLLIPPTFIAGAYGMNVGGIPWANNTAGFWWATGLCAIVVAASYIILKRLKILP
jgi:Mg2+ and Co2+ transporter CorA